MKGGAEVRLLVVAALALALMPLGATGGEPADADGADGGPDDGLVMHESECEDVQADHAEGTEGEPETVEHDTVPVEDEPDCPP